MTRALICRFLGAMSFWGPTGMIVQIYEIQRASEAQALEAVGVDHIGVLVGQGRYARELRPAQARRIFQGITKARRVALSLADDLEENWLRVLGTAELPHIDQGVCQQFHAKMSLLPVFETQE